MVDDEMISNQDLLDMIDVEGFGYAIEDYVNPADIDDPETRALWSAAKEAMSNLNAHLERFRDIDAT